MRAICKDALICDFAEYYHLYDLHSVDLRTASVLACGLPADSRSIRKITGQKYSLEMIIRMKTLDTLASIEHAYVSVHSKRKVPRPQSIFKLLSGKTDKDVQAFRSGAEFEIARERLLRGAV